jgi:hypothetical protein
MEIFTSRKGLTFKSVTFLGCEGVDDQTIIDAAMAHHNEKPANLFGSTVERDGGVATVTLYID